MTDVLIDVYDERRIVITSDNVFRDKELIMQLPGCRYETKEHRFLAPLTWATCVAMRGIFGSRLSVGSKLIEWAQREHAERVSPSLELRASVEANGDPDLYPFQRAGVQFLAFARRAMLCDAMGTGKTVQTIRTLMELTRRGENVFPTVVIAPNNMTLTWKKEFEKWWPGLTAQVIKGSAAKRREIIKTPAHVYVINWEGVRSHSRLAPYGSVRLKRCVDCDASLANVPANQRSRCEHCPKELNDIAWRTVIADEAHRMKDPRAKQTRAAWALRTKDTEFAFGLTGTPIANAPHDFWSALHFISKDEFPQRTKYIDRYCLTQFNPFGGMTITGLRQDTKEEFFKIVDPRLRRMPKEAVLPQLPKKTYATRFVEMTAKQARAYAQMEDTLVAQLDEGVAVSVNPLVQMTRLMQFASAYAVMGDNGDVQLSDPSCKIDALMDIIEEMGGESLVVFAQSRQLIDLAAARLTKHKIEHELIVGGQTPDERELAKTNFQEGKVPVILCTIAAGGIGITLTKAAAAVFLQRSWSSVDNSQAEDRVHRIGSEIHDKVTIIDVIASGTFEERQRTVLGGKLDRLEEILRDRETMRRVLGE